MTIDHRISTLAPFEPTPRPRPARNRREGPPVRDLPPSDRLLTSLLAPPSEHHLTQRLNTILEVLGGRRPAGQIEQLVDPGLFARLIAHSRLLGTRHRIGPLHVCHPTDTAVEACATIRSGPRVLALAARFQRTRPGWVCTRFHLLAPRTGPARAIQAGPPRRLVA
ncbi:Rv3235 family protein [Amycolatopsis sp. PS_44_ISF1]|uniref:Rv3235 family protein n=1 Tax=Amycolatopsis sp. PS_44_ISF1 TaxID=2974917 RepID=UPI0028DF8D76|nr:Rv3235 family protein [Amycolatopsis sp. PS_44_ISF1]MDT8911557.1 Rv3235 family protein [Amycolatopsis sp. PS_44_ISF1]